ncbi:MAG TPA: hypothetical protein VLL96_02610 [Candidatus Deferrimicrobiaceae bacterium]|jgi:hypothetical protein|nr:hypothetical protein [Candidatus Deferrimicrobiaceae bacterium]
MGFLLKEESEEKQKLFREYNLLREDVLDRSYKMWVITIVLIVGSLLVAAAPATLNFPLPVLSILLVAIAFILHSTSERISAIGYGRINQLERQLNITGPTKMYELEIAGKWWYALRRNTAYTLFIILIGVYLFLIFNIIWVLPLVIAIGVALLFVKEREPYEKIRVQL